MKKPDHILVIRFSALGDVAMMVPVLRLLLQQYPDLQVTVLSEPFVAPLFERTDRLHFIGASTKKEYRGLAGLWRLAAEIRRRVPFHAIADLHHVLRTQILRTFLWRGRIAVIDKGRAEKKSLTRPHHKNLRPLPSGFQRYADVFARLGYSIRLKQGEGLLPKTSNRDWLPNYRPGERIVGVAPFARHSAKMYPLSKMKEVVDQLIALPGIRIVLLGSRQEAAQMESWVSPNITLMAGKLSFSDELKMISCLDLVISMDSANMHLASLFGVPVLSIWGGTHPWLGFYGWGQDPANAIQEDLPCRPSSVFGNKPCPVHGEAGCMQGISPAHIVQKVVSLLA